MASPNNIMSRYSLVMNILPGEFFSLRTENWRRDWGRSTETIPYVAVFQTARA